MRLLTNEAASSAAGIERYSKLTTQRTERSGIKIMYILALPVAV
jgi:hypothetical protein